MAKQIKQKVTFKGTKPNELFDLYMNSQKHSLIAGSPVTISFKTDTPFRKYGDYITGTTVYTIKDRVNAQIWRGSDWDSADTDSVFTIVLEPKGKIRFYMPFTAMHPMPKLN